MPAVPALPAVPSVRCARPRPGHSCTTLHLQTEPTRQAYGSLSHRTIARSLDHTTMARCCAAAEPPPVLAREVTALKIPCLPRPRARPGCRYVYAPLSKL